MVKHIPPPVESTPAFPLRTIRLGIAAMIMLLLASTCLTWRVGNEIREAMDSQMRVLTAAERVEHFGTVLEMSIKSVVKHGDPEAAVEYRRVRPALGEVLQALRAEVRGNEHERDAAAVDRSNRRLIAMEYRALELAEHGRLEEARRIIYSPRYDALVDAYVQGIGDIEARAAQLAKIIRWQLDLHVWLIVAMSAASLVLVILGWIVLIVPTRRWGNQLDQARAAAEAARQLLQTKQLELELLNEQLFDQARTDALTGAATRLKFNEDMAELWPRLARQGASACVMMCDVDHFKQYNDRYGHLAGDEVLRRVAGALDGVRRGGDQLYRMGGEEFLLLLHGCSLAQAARRAEDYRAAVERLAVPHAASALDIVTISVGVAPLHASARRRLDSCLKEADEAMYEAKSRGRNAVVARTPVAA